MGVLRLALLQQHHNLEVFGLCIVSTREHNRDQLKEKQLHSTTEGLKLHWEPSADVPSGGNTHCFFKSKEWLEKEICTWINQEMNTMNKKLWFCLIETWNNSLSPFTSSLPQDTEQQRYQVIKRLRLHAQKSEILLIDWVEQKLMQSICNYGCTAGETIQRPSALSASSLQRSFSWRLCYCWSIDFLLF